MPQDQTRPDQVVDAEQVKLRPKAPVVTLLSFLLLLDPFVKLFLREERRAVDALHLLARFVALPVRTGDREQLDRFDLAGRRDVRPQAEIDERRAFDGIAAHPLAALLIDQFAFERLAHLGELLFGLGLWHLDAPVFEIALDQILHALLYLRQIFGREPPAVRALKVVIEPALRVAEQRRAYAQPRARIKIEDRRRQQVRGRMAVDLERVITRLGHEGFHALALFDDVAQIYRLILFDAVTIEARGDGLLRAIAILSFQNFKGGRAR